MKTQTKFSDISKTVGSRGARVLTLTCEERSAPTDLIARVLGLRASVVREAAARLAECELVDVEPRLHDEPGEWVIPRGAGLALDGRGFPRFRLKDGQLAHLAAVVGVRALCAKTDPGALWVPERALMREASRKKQHLADAALELKRGRIAIEVELTRKDRYKLVATIEKLLGGDQFKLVRYYVTDETRAGVERAIAEVGATRVEVLDAPARG